MQGFFNTCKSISVIHHINKLKNKNKYDHVNRCNKSFWQKSTPVYDKSSPESGNRVNLAQHNKGHRQQTHSQHHSQQRKAASVQMSTLATFIQHSFGSPGYNNIIIIIIIKVMQTGKEVKLSLFANVPDSLQPHGQ